MQHQEARAFLEDRLGIGWLAAQRETRHPFVAAWLALAAPDEHRASLLSGALPRALTLLLMLDRLDGLPVRRRSGVIDLGAFRTLLLARAKSSIADFDAVEIEAAVAWGYHGVLRMGIVAIEPGDIATPDFELKFDGLPTLVECKARSLETPERRKLDAIRQELVSRVATLLRRGEVNYGVSLLATAMPGPEDLRQALAFLAAQLPQRRPFRGVAGCFRISSDVLLATEEEVVTATLQPFGATPHVPEPTRGFMLRAGVSDSTSYVRVSHSCEVRQYGGQVIYRHPRVVVVHLAFPPDHAKATGALVRAARRQLCRTVPGVVVLRAPDFYGPAQFQSLGRAIGDALRNTRRVSGVALWHQVITRDPAGADGWTNSLRWQVFWIPNPRASHPLRGFGERGLPNGGGFEVVSGVSHHPQGHSSKIKF